MVKKYPFELRISSSISTSKTKMKKKTFYEKKNHLVFFFKVKKILKFSASINKGVSVGTM